MAVLTRALSNATTRARNVVAPGPRMSSRNDPMAAAAISDPRQKFVGKSSPELYRAWAEGSDLIRAIHDIRLGQLITAEWELVPEDLDRPKPDKGLMQRIEEVLRNPNPRDKTLDVLFWMAGEDTLTLDAGTVEKERYANGELVYLWPTDGAKVRVNKYWDGDPREARFLWEVSPTEGIELLDSDLSYWMIHPRTRSGVGLSYLETLRIVIDSEVNGILYNARMMLQATPDGILDLGENARPDQVTAFKSFFDAELAGKSMMGVWGGTRGAKWINLGRSNKDAQFMEWQKYLATKAATVYQLSVQDINLLHDINRATAEAQTSGSEQKGQKPFLTRIQNYLTSTVVHDPQWGGYQNNIAFKFRSVTNKSSLQLAEEQKLSLAGMPSASINEARRDRGLPPIGDPNDDNNPFNKLMANTPLGLVLLDKIPSAYDVAKTETQTADGAPQIGPGEDKQEAPRRGGEADQR